jgi:hypothetical protein
MYVPMLRFFLPKNVYPNTLAGFALNCLPDTLHDCAEDVDAVEGRQADEEQVEAVDQLLSRQDEAEHDVA